MVKAPNGSWPQPGRGSNLVRYKQGHQWHLLPPLLLPRGLPSTDWSGVDSGYWVGSTEPESGWGVSVSRVLAVGHTQSGTHVMVALHLVLSYLQSRREGFLGPCRGLAWHACVRPGLEAT